VTPPPRKAEPTPPPVCGYPVAAPDRRFCGAPATAKLPAGTASTAQPMALCSAHAPRFAGATVPL
jgi:hypothetical protein